MGTICILFGVIVLLAFSCAGIFASNAVLDVLSQEMYKSLLGNPNPTMVYVAIIGLCLFVGLMIFLSLLMSGLIYNRQKKQLQLMKRLSKKG